MKFLMLVCRDESIEFRPEDRGKIGAQVQAWVAEMEGRGVRLLGEVLTPVEETVIVSHRDGEVSAEPGPRHEEPAPASGFNLLECASLDEAIEVSSSHPIARYGVIELRPIAER